jgi:hypothetical protein
LKSCEDVGVGVGPDEKLEMAFQLRNDVRRDCNPATSGSCLRRPCQQMPVYVHDLFMHVDPPVQQVKIRSPQRPKLTETEPAPVSKQDHRAPSRADGTGESLHLPHAGHRPFAWSISTGALHLARIGRQHSVSYRGVEAYSKHLVRLRSDGGAFRKQGRVPRPDNRNGQLAELVRS